jgi:DNA-binding protein HU-beta
MNKKDLVQELARVRGMAPGEARLFVNSFLRTIERALSEGDSVALRSFGRFEVRPRAGRTLKTPRTRTEVNLPARLAPVFHCAPALGRRVAGRQSPKSK